MALLQLEAASALATSLASVSGKRPATRSSFLAGAPLRQSRTPVVSSASRRVVTAAAGESAAVEAGPATVVIKVQAEEGVAPRVASAAAESIVPLGLGLAAAAIYNALTNKPKTEGSVIQAAPAPQAPTFIPIPIPTYTQAPAPAPAPAPITNQNDGASQSGVASSGPKQADEATATAVAAIKKEYPNAMVDREFMRQVENTLGQLGFSGDNSIALISTCRDEITKPLVNLVDNIYGQSFNIAGLGGLISCGKTGIIAGMAHSPQVPSRDADGAIREKYIFFAFPHIAIDEDGRIGKMVREGRLKESSACLALIVARDELEKSKGSGDSYTENDIEFGLLRKKLFARKSCMCQGEHQPSLVEVTNQFREILFDELNEYIEELVDTSKADYAVITGVQIHSGCQVVSEGFKPERVVDYVAAGTCYAVVNGERYVITADGKAVRSQKVGMPSGKVLTGSA